MDTTTNGVVAAIPATINALDVAVNSAGTLYVTAFNSSSVKVVDTYSHSVIGTVNVGATPQGVVVR
jgi:YVTN family beta-propeller protein